MSEKYVAVLNIGKALAAIPLAALAAWGGATGNPVLATLLAVPAAALSSSETIGSQLSKQKQHKGDWEYFQLAAPDWWPSDSHLWENICRDIIDQLPIILQIMSERMRREQHVKTMDVVKQIFADTLIAQHSTWVFDTNEQRKIAEFVAEPILEKLNDVLGPVIEHIRKEEALIDNHNTALYTQKMANILGEMHDAAKPHTLSDRELICLHQGYCNELYKHWKMLDFKGIQHSDMNRPISIPLLDVFIFPDVLFGVPDNETLERDDDFKERDHQKKSRREENHKHSRKDFLTKKESLRSTKQNSVQREDLRTVLSKYRRLVILGDPGSGKSTILRYLLLILGESGLHFNTNFPQLASEVNNISPLYIPLATFAEVWSSNTIGERCLKDFLSKYFRDNYLDCYTEFILAQLQEGKLFILLDGLDEIPDASLRIQIVRQIEIFTHSYSKNRFVVTSRIVGYKDAPLMSEYTPYTLVDFSEEQIKEFTRKWCPAYEKWVNQVEHSQSLQQVATKEAEKLFDATRLNEGVRRLAVNPLLLTILALIQRQGIELPSHRVELFDLCVTTLLDTWLKAKGVTSKPRFSKNDLIKTLRPLAFWMHEQQSVGVIPEEELLEQIVKQLLERKITRDEVEAQRLAEEEFLQTVRGKTGILIERGRKRYGFLHLTFEEFFAAWELVLLKKDRDHFIKEHLHDPRWRVVILLAVSIIGILQNDEEGVTEIVQEAILKADSPFNKWLHRDLLLASICLADDIGVSIECKEDIIEQIVYLYITSPYNSIRTRISNVLEVWKNTSFATEAANIVLGAFTKQTTIFNETMAIEARLLTNITRFESQLYEYYCQLLRQNKDVSMHLMHLGIITVLNRLDIDISNQVDYMLSVISNVDKDVRLAAAIGLSQVSSEHPQVLEALLKALSDTDWAVRQAAVKGLGQIGCKHPQVVEALLQALSDSDVDVRQAAIIALGQLGSEHPQVVEALLQALSDSDVDVHQTALKTLGLVGSKHPQVVEALLKALSDNDGGIHRAAAAALGQLGSEHPQVVEALLKALSDPSGVLRQAAITALGQLGSEHPQVVEALLKALSDPSGVLRQAAITALGQVGGKHPQIVEALLTALSDPNWRVRQEATQALGQVNGEHPQIVEALLTALSDSDENVRQRAITALGQVGGKHPQIVEALLTALSDSDEDVRQATITALGQVGGKHPQIVEVLLTALSDPNWRVRQEAAQALGQVNGEHPQIIEALLTALSDSDEDVRQRAVTALEEIGSKRPEIIKYLSVNFLENLSANLLRLQNGDRPREITHTILSRMIALLGQIGGRHPQTIEALLKTFADNHQGMRRAATTALGLVGSGYPQVTEVLLKALSDSDKQVRWMATIALGQVGSGQPEVVEALLKTLSDSDRNVRQSAITTLGQIGAEHPEMVEALLKALSDSDEQVRQRTATALGQISIRHLEMVEALLKALSDSDEQVRWMATIALGQVGNGYPEVVEALLKALSDNHKDVCQAAIAGLGQVGSGHPEVVEALLKALSSNDEQIRCTAATGLGEIGGEHPEVVEALLKALLSDSNEQVRCTAATGLGQVGSGHPEVVEALLKALSDNSWQVHWCIIGGLGEIGGEYPEVMEALLKALSDSDKQVRRIAATRLGQVGSEHSEVVEALLKALSDPDRSVRWAVLRGLGEIGGEHPNVIEALLKALSEGSWDTRYMAARTLSQVGGEHPQMVEALLKALLDFSSGIQKEVAEILPSLTAEYLVIGELIENTLAKYDPLVTKQVTVDSQIDTLLYALQQVVGDV